MADEQTTEPAPTADDAIDPAQCVCPACGASVATIANRLWRQARRTFATTKKTAMADIETRLATVEKVLALAFNPTKRK